MRFQSPWLYMHVSPSYFGPFFIFDEYIDLDREPVRTGWCMCLGRLFVAFTPFVRRPS